MPCATVLLLELLRQCRQPQQHFALSRSTIVKDISALILCCDWLTEQGQGNYHMIEQAQSLFSRVLDQVIDYPSLPDNVRTSKSGVNSIPNTFSTMDIDTDITKALLEDPEWTTWLESFRLEPEAWFDFADVNSADLSMDNP